MTVAAPVAVVFILVWSLASNDPQRAHDRPSRAVPPRVLVRGPRVGLKIVNSLWHDGNSWPYQVKSLLEHGSELAGWTLLATGILAGALRFEAAR